MMGVARGVATWIGKNETVHVKEVPDVLYPLATKSAASPGIWITIFLAAMMALVLKRTVFGTHAYAIGSNEDTARLCGVPVERTKIWIYTLCGLFGGLGGVMTFARISVGDPTAAIGTELNVIAAVVIGGASLAGGKGSILGSMVGALLMAVLANGCNLTGVPNFVQEILIGSIIVAAVAVDRLRSGRR
jgi:ribose/xylose/arabinose/galactoside ABC-type transport system permease subunit